MTTATRYHELLEAARADLAERSRSSNLPWGLARVVLAGHEWEVRLELVQTRTNPAKRDHHRAAWRLDGARITKSEAARLLAAVEPS